MSIFPQPSRYPQLPTVTLLPSTHKSSRSVPFLSPVGTHSYQQSHCCPSHQIKAFLTFPQPSRYPQLPTVTLLPSTHKSSRSVPFLHPVGTHSYQQSHCCPPHTNQAVMYLSSAQSVPTVTKSHTAALHTQKSAQMLSSCPLLHTTNSPLRKVSLCLQNTFIRRTSRQPLGRMRADTPVFQQ